LWEIEADTPDGIIHATISSRPEFPGSGAGMTSRKG